MRLALLPSVLTLLLLLAAWLCGPAVAATNNVGFALSEEVIYLIQPTEEQKLALLDWNGKWLMSIGSEEPNQPDTLIAPVELVTDAAGNCFVLDQFGPAILHVTREGRVIRRWGERGFDRGQMRKPVDFALDDHGKLYVLDLGREAVLRFSTAGVFLDEIALDAENTDKLSWSTCIAVEPEGQFLLVADAPGVEGLLRTLSRFSASGDRLGQLTIAKVDAMGSITDIALMPEGQLVFVDHQQGTGSAYTGALYRFTSLADMESRIFLTDLERGRRFSPVRVKVWRGAMYALTQTNLLVRVSADGRIERSWGAGEL